jgi:hypothetical protein
VLLPCERWRVVRDGCGAWLIVDERGGQPHRDDKLLQLAHGVIADSRPSLREQMVALDAERGGQRELDFEVA